MWSRRCQIYSRAIFFLVRKIIRNYPESRVNKRLRESSELTSFRNLFRCFFNFFLIQIETCIWCCALQMLFKKWRIWLSFSLNCFISFTSFFLANPNFASYRSFLAFSMIPESFEWFSAPKKNILEQIWHFLAFLAPSESHSLVANNFFLENLKLLLLNLYIS